MTLTILQFDLEEDYRDDDDDYDDDYGYPAYSHQSYSHQVGICHNDEGWEYDTVTFPPYTKIMMSTITWIQYHTSSLRTARFVDVIPRL